ncbi:MAG: OsmC family protein [Cyclobacteriaceae bacterium]|jgi:putative redox protein|nr:OsmC family protein [Cyclobacteriaceae bacterium]
MTIKLNYKEDKKYEAINESGNILPIDMLAVTDKEAFSPTQLLLAGVASCAAVDLVSMIKKRRKVFVDLKAVISGVRRETDPKSFTDIDLKYIITSPDLTEKEAERLVFLAVNNYCSVSDCLRKDINLQHSFELVKG